MISVQVVADALEKEFGSFFTTEAHPPSDILKYISAGCRWVSNQRDWGFNQKVTSFTTTVANETQAIQETCQVFSVTDVDQNPVHYFGEIKDYYAVNTDLENYVGIWDTTFIAKTPGTYTVIHSVYPNPVTSLLDTIPFPQSLEQLVIESSLAFGFFSVKDDDNATTHLNLAKEYLPPIAVRKTDPTPNKVRRVGSAHSF